MLYKLGTVSSGEQEGEVKPVEEEVKPVEEEEEMEEKEEMEEEEKPATGKEKKKEEEDKLETMPVRLASSYQLLLRGRVKEE